MLLKTSMYLELHWRIFQTVHCTGWNNCSYSKKNSSVMDVLFLMSPFRLYPGLKLWFDYNSARKIFPSACLCWDSSLSLRGMDQKPKFSGTIGCEVSSLEFLFRHFKTFRLYAKLYDAVGTVRGHSGKVPSYRYIDGLGANSCLLGHVTALHFCLFINSFCLPFSALPIFEAVCLALYSIVS